MKITPVRKLPVTTTGIYENRKSGEWEYWLAVDKGKGAGLERVKIGGCKIGTEDFIFNHWARQTNLALKALILRLMRAEDLHLTIDGTTHVRSELDVADYMRHNRLQH